MYAVIERDTPKIFRPFFSANFVHMGAKGVANSILGLNRTRMECHQIYCHFSDPRTFLREYDSEVNLIDAVLVILGYIVVCHAVAFIFVVYRLKNMKK